MFLEKSAILLLWLGAVIDPIGSMFGLRYFALAASFVALVWLLSTGTLKSVDRSFRGLLILQLAGVLPIYGLFLYSFRASNQDFLDTSYLAAGILMLTSLLYRNRRMCEFGIRSLVLSTRLLSTLVIATFAAQIFAFSEWLEFLTERDIAIVSFREYAGIELPYIYFVASPLLILLMAHDFGKFLQRKNLSQLLRFVLTAFCFALTGTRAHMLIAIAFAPLYMLLSITSKSFVSAIATAATLVIFTLLFQDGRELINSFFSTSETNNSMKLSLLDGYWEIFSSPHVLILGQGFNAHEWSVPLRSMIAMEVNASKTELTYLELIRVFGICLASAFICTLLMLVTTTKKLSSDLRWLYPSFAIYLINAALNPYLFSVNGILPLGLIAAITYYYRPAASNSHFAEARSRKLILTNH